MRNRFSKVSRGKSWLLILLAISGMTSSCKDEYFLDDEKPTWLDVSIYDNLTRRGTFSNYLRLLADPDVNSAEDADNNRNIVDILSKTGSKTVFVADDNAWEQFFQQNASLPENNPWHYATSYENLSVSQKKLLINTSMLPNSIVMENLSTAAQTNTRGENLRRQTDVANTDTIAYLKSDELPISYNEGGQEVDYWSRFRAEKGGKGIYLVNDGTPSMMIHFTNEYLKKKNITDKDFEKFLGQARATNDVHIYDHKLISKDSVCENGYVNTTEGVLKPLPNMAELIRTNGKTNIFSHMLDRWSVPFYNDDVTKAYKDVMAAKGIEWTDSIFSKRYFSSRSKGGALTKDPWGNDFSDGESKQLSLRFDPGWNAYYPDQSTAEQDMATIFVPTDEALWEFFLNDDSGKGLIKTYANNKTITPGNYTSLYQAIDQIPLSTLCALVNVIMFDRFSQSVPSKMLQLRNDVQEQIFQTEDRDKHLVGSELACNGIVYFTDKVYAPGDFTSVAAPAFVSKDKRVIKWAIFNGSDGITANDKMGIHYYAYLRAMQSKFVFLMPDDNAMQYLYYPVSFLSKYPRVIQLFMKDKKATVEVGGKIFLYNPETGERGNELPSSVEKLSDDDVIELLKDLLESHTIVLDGIDNIDEDENEYYLAKNGAPIRVIRENGRVVKVQGGLQMENELKGLDNVNPGVKWNEVTEPRDMKNGTTYILDSPMANASRSVYNIFTNNQQYDSEKYGAFYELCITDDIMEEAIQACGLVPASTKESQLEQLMKKYRVFDNEGETTIDYNVQFFNNYHYTIFVPTREAVEQAIVNGLPTPEGIAEDFQNSCVDPDDYTKGLKTAQDSLRLQTKITYLLNFIRNHFVDNSVFVDKSRIPETEYVTACFDEKVELFNKIYVQREAGILQVKDSKDGQWQTVSTTPGTYNIMAHDVNTSKSPYNQGNLSGLKIQGSSFAVIHQIPGILNHTPLGENGQHIINWDDESSCRAYLKRYAIK